MMSVTLSNDKIYKGSLLLVNAQYPVQDFGEERMIPVTEDTGEIRLRREAVYILRLIFERIHCSDSIVPVSAYRSAREQTEIYETSLKTIGKILHVNSWRCPITASIRQGLPLIWG